ncbi:Urease accessory protein ureD [Granulibacter bethesdensis CGDNIH1]|uniref:Urease accessory protein UreD n=2 Tax=Granulibacter bethesdensis TaxID=364410 RepID=URED_GRABC|nr:RecName: Full=Urease accessory protein UreD [Granulibacter bethesdensis CGDNIH1]ABI63059.1 Urease accessory protein ureD [Granulibacter bethesdensis CGDNIH1]APH52932.1 Urease accessory protein ureD [Granulibacter bethesdensis]APH65620.1 Urease accessory protein ureD [Granulibacter bethesdensis]
MLMPMPEPDEAPVAALVNIAGGLAGGDRLSFTMTLDAQARATLCTAAAEKVYRSLGPDTDISNILTAGPEAALEWLPQETILFNGARLRRRMNVSLATDARLLATETIIFGRTAHQETFLNGHFSDHWRLWRDGKLLWADNFRLPDPPARVLDHPFGLNRHPAMATIVLAATDAAAYRDLLREKWQDETGKGVTVPRPGLLLGRLIGSATAVRQGVEEAMIILRTHAMHGPARLPRLWLS